MSELKTVQTTIVKKFQAVRLTHLDGLVSYDIWDSALVKHIDNSSVVHKIEAVGEPVTVSVCV